MTGSRVKKTLVNTTVGLAVVLFLGLLNFLFGGGANQYVSQNRVDFTLSPIEWSRESFQLVYARYPKKAQESQLFWDSPNLGGITLYYAPSEGAIYGKGTRKADDRLNKFIRVYVRIGEVKEAGGKKALVFPRGTRFLYYNPSRFFGGEVFPGRVLTIELPSDPPEVDKERFKGNVAMP